MSITTPELGEEARAQLWRDQVQRRIAYQQGLWSSLAGSPLAAAALRERWSALELYLLEAQQPSVEPQDDPGFDVFHQSDQVNVGQ